MEWIRLQADATEPALLRGLLCPEEIDRVCAVGEEALASQANELRVSMHLSSSALLSRHMSSC